MKKYEIENNIKLFKLFQSQPGMVTPHSLSKHQVMGATTGPVTAIGLMVRGKKE